MAPEEKELRHLLSRTGFGVPRADELLAYAGLAYGEAVSSLLDSVNTTSFLPEPDWLDVLERAPSHWSTDQKKQWKKDRNKLRNNAMPAWWYGEILSTPSPFTERMVLFWHGHFTSSAQRVKHPPLMYEQNVLFREHATGNFADLLHAVSKDPAMMVYLDTDSNTRSQPNENYARELMELFTLGEGRGYTEEDVVEAARALTGWRYERERGFRVAGRDRDIGQKTILGQTGRFDGVDLIDILLDQPRLAEHITARLWHSFISNAPDPSEVRRLAAIFRDSGYEIRPLLEGLFMSAAFRDPANRGTMVKSPTDLIAGTLRLIHYQPTEIPMLMHRVGRDLGQELFKPPNVKGWPGGLAWIDTSLLPERYAFLSSVSHVVDALERRGQMPSLNSEQRRAMSGVRLEDVDRNALRALARTAPDQLAEHILPLPRSSSGSPGKLGTYFLDPTYQLK